MSPRPEHGRGSDRNTRARSPTRGQLRASWQRRSRGSRSMRSACALTSGMADGMAKRREVLGDEHVDRAIEKTTDFTADFQDLLTRYAWEEVWTRPGLD